MKHTKKIICIALCLFTALTLFSACGKKDEPTGKELLITEETTEEEFIAIEELGKETEKHTEKETTTKKAVTTTQRAIIETKRYENTTSKQSVATKKPTPPSTTKKPEQTTQRRETTTKKQEVTTTNKTEPTTKKPVTTTKPEATKTKPYSCGNKNHHCTTKEEHAFIKSLESKGCSICGSHLCRSFYAIDEWGNNCYDITKCPKYSEKKDPANYCEHCGKEIGLGDDGTCVRFTVETKCPICGKKVPAKTCHTH